MSNELHFDGETGKTYDAYIFNTAGQVAVTAGTSFEDWVAADTYDIELIEVGDSGHFVGTFPSAIAAGLYGVGARERAGTNPANTDEKVGPATDFEWDGSAEITRSSVDALIDAIKVKTDFLPSATAGEETGIMLTNHITADSGVVEASVEQFLGTAITETTPGYVADAFTDLYDIATTVIANVQTAAFNALNTEVEDLPTPASIMSFVKTGYVATIAMDTLTKASGPGDLAAVKSITDAIPDAGALTALLASIAIIDTAAAAIQGDVEADIIIVTSTTPWEVHYRTKGTETVRFKKQLKDITGADITAVTSIIGQHIHTT